MIHLVQLVHPQQGRRIARVAGDRLELLLTYPTVYAAATTALAANLPLTSVIESASVEETLEYDPIYAGGTDWLLLPPFDHPEEPARCLVSGTGLTHRKSADNRQAMHQTSQTQAAITDSMRMYEWGREGGRPESGKVGVQPEWFYKGCGAILRAHGDPLDVPEFAEDGGEEAELVGLYLIDSEGAPRRVGFAQGNEFSDHVMERKNYLYLAPSKLRTCALGPELVLDADVQDVRGSVRLERGGALLWEQAIATGEANMTHTLENLEYHHFKYPAHRRPGDVHIHFFGADAFSFGAGIALQDGDTMTVSLSGFGRPLCNPARVIPKPAVLSARLVAPL